MSDSHWRVLISLDLGAAALSNAGSQLSAGLSGLDLPPAFGRFVVAATLNAIHRVLAHADSTEPRVLIQVLIPAFGPPRGWAPGQPWGHFLIRKTAWEAAPSEVALYLYPDPEPDLS